VLSGIRHGMMIIAFALGVGVRAEEGLLGFEFGGGPGWLLLLLF